MKKFKLFKLNLITILFLSFLAFPFISNAAVVLSDDFTGTTIDTNKWIEADSAGGGSGGTVGNVQQNNSLTMVGSGAWGVNGLRSVNTFNRATGDLTIEGDWTINTSCSADSKSSVAVMYGTWVSSIPGNGATIALLSFGTTFKLWNGTTQVAVTGVTCQVGTPIHFKLIIRQAGGADVYLNNSVTANGSLSVAQAPNTYNNNNIILQQYSNLVNSSIGIDNIVVTTSDAPSAPTNLTLIPSSGEMILSWTAPSSIGSAITDYLIEYKLSSDSTWTTFSHSASTAVTTTINGLTNDESYDFRVSAINGIGTGTSVPGTATPSLTVPYTPTSLTASFGPNTHINLSWIAPVTDGGSVITDYLIQYKLNSEPTTWTTFVDGVSTATSAVVTGLLDGSTYDFKVSAINSIGTGTASSSVSKRAGAYLLYDDFTGTNIDTDKWTEYDSTAGGAGGTAGRVQQNGSLSLVGSTAWNTNALKSVQTFARNLGNIIIEADWTVNNCSAVTGVGGISYGNWVTNGTMVNSTILFQFNNGVYKLFYWPSGISSAVSCTNGVPTHVKIVIKQAGGVDVFLNGNVTPTLSANVGNTPATWTNQTISLQQYDASNSFFDNFIVYNTGFTTPGIPTNLTATPRDSQVELSWTTPLNGGSDITDYMVEYKLSADPTWTTFPHEASVSTTSFVTGLINGSSYDFRVSAVNINGPGTASSITTTSPVESTPSAPQNFAVNITTSSQADLSWGAPVSNGGSVIIDYVIKYKLTSEPTTWTTFVDGVSTVTGVNVTGLTDGLSYDFKISASNINGEGTTSSVITKAVASPNQAAPTANSVLINGYPYISEYLSGSYIYFDQNADPEGTTLFRWLSSETSNGEYSAIPGATSRNYAVTSSELNKYIKFEVTPISSVVPTNGVAVLSSAIGPITQSVYIYQILSTGQSLSLGYVGTPTLSTTQPYSNKMLSGSDLVPLVESGMESPASAMGNGITFQNGKQMVVTKHGVGATAYAGLKKGTTPYSNGMAQVTAVKDAASMLGKTAQIAGVTTVHGESDYSAGNDEFYEGYLVEWQHDYETDIKAINGQIGTIPMFTDQMSSWITKNSSAYTSGIPIAQLAASEDYPGKIILVGPKYFLNYSTGPHLTNASYRWLGEYYAKVIKKVYFDNETWRPLSPDTIQRSSNIIYAKFHVPTGILALDTTLVRFKENYGFEYFDATSSASISSVEIINSDTVKITLSNVPTGANQRLRYAYTGTPLAAPGAQSEGSPRGNLRDTDSAVSLSGNTLYDWAVHFDKPITSVSDMVVPTVSAFSIPSTSTSLTISIDSFTATDNYYVDGYKLTESSSAPLAGDSGWTGTAPTTYTFATAGSKTLYAWAKDAAGNVSAAQSDTIEVSLIVNSYSFTGPTSGTISTSSSLFTITPSISFTGTVTITPSGSASSGLSAVILTFSNSSAPQTFTITPTILGTIVLTPTNNGSMINASNISYTVEAPVADITPPVISNIISTPTTDSVSITWTTDESSSSILDYGLSSTYDSSTGEMNTSPRVTSHNLQISNLVSCVTYHFSVSSIDGSDNESTSDDETFTTTGCVGSATVDSQNTDSINATWGGIIDLISDNTGITLDVPADFSDTNADFQIKKLNKNEVLVSISEPNGFTSVGTYIYDLKALSDNSTAITVFDNLITISIDYSSSDVSRINESSLKIYRWDGAGWIELSGCIVNTEIRRVTCLTDHFSVFGLFGMNRSSSSRSGGGSSSRANVQPLVQPLIQPQIEPQLPIEPVVPEVITPGIYKFTRDLNLG